MVAVWLSNNRGMDKEDVVYIYTMKYYSAKKKNKVILFVVTSMDLEIMTLSEASQTKKHTSHVISLFCGVLK